MKKNNKEIIYRFSCLLTHYFCIFALEHRMMFWRGRRCDFRVKQMKRTLFIQNVS